MAMNSFKSIQKEESLGNMVEGEQILYILRELWEFEFNNCSTQWNTESVSPLKWIECIPSTVKTADSGYTIVKSQGKKGTDFQVGKLENF